MPVRRSIVVAAGSVALVVSVGVGLAIAAPSADVTSAPTKEFTNGTAPASEVNPVRMANRDAMDELATWLDEHKTLESRGFVTLVMDVDARSMVVNWSGMTDQQAAEVRSRAKALGVTVTFVDVPYDSVVADAAVQRLADQRDALKAEGIEMGSIYPHPREGVLPRVEVILKGASDAAKAKVRSRLSEIAGIRIDVVFLDARNGGPLGLVVPRNG